MTYFDAQVKLEATDENLVTSFEALNSFNDVADLLEITPKHLHYVLFEKKNLYFQFERPKKDGGVRQILTPCDSLKILQQKLNRIFNLVYKPKSTAHGFVKNKSIITNAQFHLNKHYVLNFDLADFFESIHRGRVYGVLRGYFNIGHKAAHTIASICCYKNVLPQGAPTSPLLSNMVCFQLDKDLLTLAKGNSCVYTRYADDITISTTKKEFPKVLATASENSTFLGNQLISIIEKNGFSINDSKTRLHSKFQQLRVTGITVNEKLNVKRDYIKKIRAVLRSLETNSLEEAQKIFVDKYTFRYRYNADVPNVLNVLKGKINHVGLVKGKEDQIFQKLARRYNAIVDEEVFNIIHTDQEIRELYTHVINSGIWYDDEFFLDQNIQGTGFFLNNIGFVTNAHVVRDLDKGNVESIAINRSRYDEQNKPASIEFIDYERDIAILQVDGHTKSEGFLYNTHHGKGQDILLLGYPNHDPNNSLYVEPGTIVQYTYPYMDHVYNPETGELGTNQERITISSRIIVGNSGGPVVNQQNEVIGVATKGFKNYSQSSTDDSTATSIMVEIEDVLAVVS